MNFKIWLPSETNSARGNISQHSSLSVIWGRCGPTIVTSSKKIRRSRKKSTRSRSTSIRSFPILISRTKLSWLPLFQYLNSHNLHLLLCQGNYLLQEQQPLNLLSQRPHVFRITRKVKKSSKNSTESRNKVAVYQVKPVLASSPNQFTINLCLRLRTRLLHSLRRLSTVWPTLPKILGLKARLKISFNLRNKALSLTSPWTSMRKINSKIVLVFSLRNNKGESSTWCRIVSQLMEVKFLSLS